MRRITKLSAWFFIFFITFGQTVSDVPARPSDGGVSVVIDGRPFHPAHDPQVIDGRVFIAAEDIFGALYYDMISVEATGAAVFISSDIFFTVSRGADETFINGVETDVSWAEVGGILYVCAVDLPKLARVAVSTGGVDGRALKIVNRFTSSVTVHNDDYLFPFVGSYSVSGGRMFLGVYDLAYIFMQLEIEVEASGVSAADPAADPADGSRAFFAYSGVVEYGTSSREHVGPDVLFKNANGSDSKMIDLEHFARFVGYELTIEKTEKCYYLDIISKSYGEGRAKKTPPRYATAAPDFYDAAHATAGINALKRDGGFVLNVTVMDRLAERINMLRQANGHEPLGVDHALLYAPQSGKDPLRNTGFDNLRWCREDLSGRTLEHMQVKTGYYELLIINAIHETTAARMADALYGSEPHREIMMSDDVREFGVAAIQYPNGDVDIACVFR